LAWYSEEMQELSAVAVATMDFAGNLLEANRGFLRLLPDREKSLGAACAQYFIQPDFSTLLECTSAEKTYEGLLTVGTYTGQTRTLKARVWRTDVMLRIFAEPDMDEMERLQNIVLELNKESAAAQVELTQANLRLQQREAQVRALTMTDTLTNLGNRRRLDESLVTEVSRVARTGEPRCALMADLDHFKNVNDQYGHQVGDEVLVAFGALLRQTTRPTDVVTRYGGEEFVVLMPHTALRQAIEVAERIRTSFEKMRIAPITHPVTVSCGVAQLVSGETGDSLLKRIDLALYEAKHSGRNRVVAV